jgi:hypothetical protein
MPCTKQLLENQKLRNRACYGNSDVSKWRIIFGKNVADPYLLLFKTLLYCLSNRYAKLKKEEDTSIFSPKFI